MTDLHDRRVLVVEDDYLLADELVFNLLEAGATVLGPLGSVQEALALIDAEADIDSAVLDANLHGESVFAVADRLLERHVPFVFTTGYDAGVFPARFEQVARCEKPVNFEKLSQALCGRRVV